jgi:hypothetical protein
VLESAIVWAEFFGPPTDCVWGHDKKRRSHCLHTLSQGIITIQYRYRCPTLRPASRRRKCSPNCAV